MTSWWQNYPQEFEAELDALRASDFQWEIRKDDQEQGRLVIDLQVTHEGVAFELTAEYPDSYPYFPPQVTVKNHFFTRHQHPWNRNLCLLERENEDWRPGVDRLATLVEDQFPQIYVTNQKNGNPDLQAEIEDHIGEPFSAFLQSHPHSSIVVPDSSPSPTISHGYLKLKKRKLPEEVDNPAVVVNGAIEEIQDSEGKPILAGVSSPPVFTDSDKAFWMRLPGPPDVAAIKDAGELQTQLIQNAKDRIIDFRKRLAKAKTGTVIIIGFVYEDEVEWREHRDDWFFIAIRVEQGARKSRPSRLRTAFVRPDWGGEEAWLMRAPFLQSVRDKKVVLIGVGSLGSSLALKLASAGVGELHLIDRDVVQVGNTIRWALGWQAAGLLKTHAIAGFIETNYPYTRVQPHYVNIGLPHGAREQSDRDVLEHLVGHADLVIDASASYRVNHFIADLTASMEKPYLWLTTTHGAAGGTLGRVVPGKTKGCWHCFQYALGDKTIEPPADSGGEDIQPGGCAQATFIGAGIDSEEVVVLGCRLAIATLSDNDESRYPDFDWDVAVGDFWDKKTGVSLAPRWTTSSLGAHQHCNRCSP
ncbi:ThiF family adenylyltransferase [Marinobacter sp. SS13-12]|uniref:ThiF family adenylyltransferase n=1 Tax=Marinobacter sp. SS13-12 TaxID=3050451 RepID=UPI0025532EE0|nr:ThiF family adenylyltransferase [Marinobacter sp. SS13-12]MDK8465476.1 ThiF family adenylyltransferase [Marinobacter sp. SS13-12]